VNDESVVNAFRACDFMISDHPFWPHSFHLSWTTLSTVREIVAVATETVIVEYYPHPDFSRRSVMV